LLATFVASSLRLAMPLIMAATGELVSELAGVLNLSLEGMMLLSAFFGVWGASLTGNPWIGLLFGIASGLGCAVVQAILSVRLRANQLVVGIGFNILALGATTLLYREIFGALSGQLVPGFGHLAIPFLSNLPFFGSAFLQQNLLLYVGLVLVCGLWTVIRFTGFGLAARAIGDDPRAADRAGVSVARVRYGAVLITGAMAGVSGVLISVGDIRTFTEGMTNGAGYLAIAAVIFGGWRLWPTVGACLLFGAAAALQFELPTMGIVVPTAILLMLPYILALLAVAGLVSRREQPAALTLPFLRGR